MNWILAERVVVQGQPEQAIARRALRILDALGERLYSVGIRQMLDLL